MRSTHTSIEKKKGGGVDGKQSERVFLHFPLNHCAVYILKAHACKNIVSNLKLVLRPRTRLTSSVPHSAASCVGVSEPEKGGSLTLKLEMRCFRGEQFSVFVLEVHAGVLQQQQQKKKTHIIMSLLLLLLFLLLNSKAIFPFCFYIICFFFFFLSRCFLTHPISWCEDVAAEIERGSVSPTGSSFPLLSIPRERERKRKKKKMCCARVADE